jgi:hypothetical protein
LFPLCSPEEYRLLPNQEFEHPYIFNTLIVLVLVVLLLLTMAVVVGVGVVYLWMAGVVSPLLPHLVEVRISW